MTCSPHNTKLTKWFLKFSFGVLASPKAFAFWPSRTCCADVVVMSIWQVPCRQYECIIQFQQVALTTSLPVAGKTSPNRIRFRPLQAKEAMTMQKTSEFAANSFLHTFFAYSFLLFVPVGFRKLCFCCLSLTAVARPLGCSMLWSDRAVALYANFLEIMLTMQQQTDHGYTELSRHLETYPCGN